MSALQAGTNVIAVEVHQAAADSTDLSFDLELSGVANRPPLVAIVEPIHNSIVSTGMPVTLQAHTGDDFSVTNVSYFVNGHLIANTAAVPFSSAWTNPLPGTADVVAVATDNDGLSTTSAPVRITIAAPLIARGSLWRYSDRGVDLGTSWRALGYDDSGWSTGLAELGYGDDDEATVVSFGSNDQSKHPTTYFRQRFVVNAAAQYTNLLLRLLRDDGGIAYLNGTEVFRSNMPNGPVTYATLASGGAADETRYYETQVASSLLREGTNVIAVEIHQATLDSSDLSFDLELLGLGSQAWPMIAAQRLGAKVQLRWPVTADGHLLETTLDPASGIWQPCAAPLTTNGVFIEVIITASDNQRYFRLRR